MKTNGLLGPTCDAFAGSLPSLLYIGYLLYSVAWDARCNGFFDSCIGNMYVSVHTETYLSCFRSRDSLSLFEVECAMKPLIFIPSQALYLFFCLSRERFVQ